MREIDGKKYYEIEIKLIDGSTVTFSDVWFGVTHYDGGCLLFEHNNIWYHYPLRNILMWNYW